jgi:hypothetical protein
MNTSTRTHLDNIRSKDHATQGEAYQALLRETENPVDWAYEAWDELIANLTSKDNRLRSIASHLLSNLAAKSDSKGHILKDFDTLLNVTRDEKFVTARHSLQSLWKIGAAGKKQRKVLLDGLTLRFKECSAEKNGALTRYDILEAMRKLYDAAPDDNIKKLALELIETEPDLACRKKYAPLWKFKKA